MRFTRLFASSIAILLLVGLTASPASARAILVGATPTPNSTLDRPPARVILTFNSPIDPATVSLRVVDAVGVHVDNADTQIFSGDRTTLVVSLPPLEEGLYTVIYTVTESETGMTTSDSYQFALDFPTPQIRILSPPNGAGFQGEKVTVEIDTGAFDLAFWQYWWRLYLDDREVTTTRDPSVTLDDLEPGPHEIRAVLVNQEDTELHSTQTAIHVAVGLPDPEAEELEMAATGPGAPGPTLSQTEAILLAVVVIICLGAGIAVGRQSAAVSR